MSFKIFRQSFIYLFLLVSIIFPNISFSAGALQNDLTQLSLEDLMNLEVYSATKKPQKMFGTAAAIYVITPEDIRRSGATNIPELLRMVPGVSVHKVNSHAWDISARGFNNSIFANKMLVLIDGRSVYTPLFAGVFWDVQDVVLEDIERIEVIRGPGGTLWGANAVNGVINVITKKAKDTQGTLVSVGGGSEERAFSTIRYGGHSQQDWDYRVYTKYFDRAGGYRSTGTANDEWEIARGGFKAEKEKLTLQGDFYDGAVGQRTNIFSYTAPHSYIIDKPVHVQGANLLSRYEEDDWSLQGYWDMTKRNLHTLGEQRNVFDLEYNRKMSILSNQELNWGLGYRLNMEDINNTNTASIDTPSEADQIFSFFVQDEAKFMEDKLALIFGSKVEHNIYTNLEVQPNARVSYDVNENNMVWAAASRAVRTPSRFEEDGRVIASFVSPSTFNETGRNRDLSSERLDAYEIGYRTQPISNVFIDLALFNNHYDRIITFIPGPTQSVNGLTVNTFPAVNGVSGDVHGAEVSSEIQMREWWKLKGAYTFTKMNLQTDTDITNIGLETALEQAVPRHAFYLRSSFDLPSQFELDTILRYSDSVFNNRVPDMIELDINLTKRIQEWEIALVGQNLLRSHHREAVLTTASQTERGGYLKVTRRF